MKRSIPSHPFAELFPLHDGPSIWELRKDLEENGQVEPIATYQGQVLDGRRRQVCCIAVGIKPRYKFEGTEAEALAFVVSKNLKRRHLNDDERAGVAANVANMGEGRQSTSAGALVAQPDAAKLMNVSVPALQRAKAVQEHGSDELKAGIMPRPDQQAQHAIKDRRTCLASLHLRRVWWPLAKKS